MIERHEVEAFLALAEELHFGRTAERLHVSTARVSQTIRKLERRVGVPLFLRTSRRVELTATGKQLREDLGPAWAGVCTALERAVEAGRGVSGTLQVTFVSAAAAQLLVGVTKLFRERVPDCEVHIREVQAGQLLPWLRSGEVDLALTTLPAGEPDMAAGPVLVREARMLAVPADHPFARRGTVSADDLARVRLVQLPDHGAEPPRRSGSATPTAPGPTAGTFQEALTLVGAGQGALPVGAHTRRYYARPDVSYVPIDDAPPLEWGLIWPADRCTARVRAFADAAVDLVDGHG
ncbi:LysR family transcriptional regulator [Kitasatospora sp. RG8]|uniref:LysR family transcriptional regulator n=1 Tax=Kitasatospora sp. RG8 TaxID=2820815 RepID=UPI001ADF9CC0|nr:LysR family transcriptional regulator [Kitasatospora sp. RG8]MBP0454848.1 LysR family transcriptional regulator [Kitasatospora sp. RG8]